ncbi:L,D-transpeptidase [Rhodoplanes sp. TEM]|uniref:L,D-transpeptidase n=1 Tax=Rhodoplanes tepidamans TaxID=200616 RepID=A0ABT5J6X5_RHOTP|nr:MULTISPECIES: L,D-transpeptidase [Rhodoplanes]MDC7785417.1 L,D-transpeptidase [Rhodoplanes tepidamans]MDC7986954.1 L,D-transpeptidase [Rhodoplanes sp. TEM]MDQ0353130.1 lipoprotein-anchoring transpeptidase ErfK/SrfK [Rhodoplanes tepidamans]
MNNFARARSVVVAAGVATLVSGTLLCGALVSAANANPFSLFAPALVPAAPATETVIPRDETPGAPAARFRRQIVDYKTSEPAGTIIVDTPNTYLYYVLGNGRAVRYGIGVGRDGFRWSGTQTITRKAEWPDWTPPSEMVRRQPYLPRFVAGGPNNPLGARALYLGETIYRIHGTNAPETIGERVSSGCIRMVNADVIDLYSRVTVGTRVIVLPSRDRRVDAVRDTQG